jgi:hypothetical protein
MGVDHRYRVRRRPQPDAPATSELDDPRRDRRREQHRTTNRDQLVPARGP